MVLNDGYDYAMCFDALTCYLKHYYQLKIVNFLIGSCPGPRLFDNFFNQGESAEEILIQRDLYANSLHDL